MPQVTILRAIKHLSKVLEFARAGNSPFVGIVHQSSQDLAKSILESNVDLVEAVLLAGRTAALDKLAHDGGMLGISQSCEDPVNCVALSCIKSHVLYGVTLEIWEQIVSESAVCCMHPCIENIDRDLRLRPEDVPEIMERCIAVGGDTNDIEARLTTQLR